MDSEGCTLQERLTEPLARLFVTGCSCERPVFWIAVLFTMATMQCRPRAKGLVMLALPFSNGQHVPRAREVWDALGDGQIARLRR